MRKIKFRGMDYNKEWVFGGVSFQHNRASIHGDELPYGHGFEVDPKTVSQFTGLQDKNGREIYEGDILKCYRSEGKNGELRGGYVRPLPVEYSNQCCQFVLVDKQIKAQYGIWESFEVFEVIGNIYENPDLLEG